MKVTVPFHYAVSYVLKRHRNSNSVYFASEAELEFRSIPRDAVRTVMRLGKRNKDDHRAANWSFGKPFAAKDDGSKRDVVQFEGCLWVESVPLSDVIEGLEKRGGEDTPFADMRLLQDTGKDQYGNVKTRIYQSHFQVRSRERIEIREINDDGGERVRRALTRRAASLISIDGMLYARCREPMLKIGGGYGEKEIDFCGPYRSISRDTSKHKYAYDDSYVFDHDVPLMWSVTELAHGRGEWRRTSKARLTDLAEFEILDPEVLTACPHVGAFLHHATQALKKLWEHPMALRHGVLERAVELRDAIEGCGRQITPRLRRAVTEIAAIQAIPEDEVNVWRGRAAGRPRMVTYNGHYHHGPETPLTRASQVIAHADNHLDAARDAETALRRYKMRGSGLSWEDRALELNSIEDDGKISYELLSSQAVALHAEKLEIDPAEAIRAARHDAARIFVVGSGGLFAPSLIAIVDEAPSGEMSVREILHGDSPAPSKASLALLERHLEAAVPRYEAESELALAPGMSS